MTVLKIAIAFTLAVLTTFVAASIFHTQNVLAGLQSLGVDIPLELRAHQTWRDFTGFASLKLFPLMITIAFAVGFPIAFLMKRVVVPLAPLAYPIAGAAAIGTLLWVMHINFSTTPIAGARGIVGFSMQMLAGALGGWVFAMMPRQRG